MPSFQNQGVLYTYNTPQFRLCTFFRCSIATCALWLPQWAAQVLSFQFPALRTWRLGAPNCPLGKWILSYVSHLPCQWNWKWKLISYQSPLKDQLKYLAFICDLSHWLEFIWQFFIIILIDELFLKNSIHTEKWTNPKCPNDSHKAKTLVHPAPSWKTKPIPVYQKSFCHFQDHNFPPKVITNLTVNAIYLICLLLNFIYME